jgi:hypothetical protein
VDKLGNVSTSLPVRIFVQGTAIVSPVPNTIVPKGSSVIITAEATRAQGFIKQVEFFVNRASIGTDFTAPYSIPYTPAATGDYSLTAVATDNNNALLTESEAVKITVVNPIGTPPSVSIVNPIPGSTLFAGKSVTVTANASDADGFISKVEFYLNGNLIDTDQSFPYSTTWQPVVAGSYSLMAIASDDKGNAVASDPAVITVKAGLPTIEISSPTAGATSIIQGSKVAVTVRAAGADGGITSLSSITLLVDGADSSSLPNNPDNLDPPPSLAEPFTFEWSSNVSIGAHTLSARVTDKNGLSITSAEVPITIISNVPPTVTITSPASGSSVPLGQVITVAASAIDIDGSIASVAFTVNGTALATDTTAPYSASYTPVASGTYLFQAIATDNIGKAVSSAVTTITVAAPVGSPPYVGLTINNPSVDYSDTPAAAPTEPIKVSYGSRLLLGASALDVDGTITKVEFYANGSLISTSYSAPYNVTCYVNTVGLVDLIAVAYDNDGNKVSSTPVQIQCLATTGTGNLAVQLLSPLGGSTYVAGEAIAFSASSNLGDAGPPKMDFYIDNYAVETVLKEPYSISKGISVPGTYQIRAVVRHGNFTTVSAPALVTIVGNQSPVVTLDTPAQGDVLALGQSIFLSASASDPDGSIAKVGFYVNGTLVASDTSIPYSASYTPPAAGTYTVYAVATDNVGMTKYSTAHSISVGSTVGKQPQISILLDNPAGDGSSSGSESISIAYGSKLFLRALAADADGSVSKVEFFANGVFIGSSTSAPYSLIYQLKELGTVYFMAIVTDNSGNRVASAVSQVTGVLSAVDPGNTVTLRSPATGASYVAGQSIPFAATTTLSGAKVDFYVGPQLVSTVSQSPYSASISLTNPGTYEVRAVARLGSFTTVSSSSLVTVMENAAPTVSLTSPVSGTLAFGQSLFLSASASDPDGSIAKVSFYVNDTLVASDSSAPYSASYTPPAAGSYTVYAVATDNLGLSTYSANLGLSVAATVGKAPQVGILLDDPAGGSASSGPSGISIANGSKLFLRALAADADGSVSKVEFYANGVLIGSSTSAPYTLIYQLKELGTVYFSAIVTDDSGNRVASTVSQVTGSLSAVDTSNTVTLKNPVTGASYVAGENIPCTATTTLSGAKVDFYVGTQLVSTVSQSPYSASISLANPGSYEVRAVARLDTFTTVSSSSRITVKANVPPSVSITSPANGTLVSMGTACTLVASAADQDGTVAQVEFFANDISLGKATQAPYEVSFTPGSEGLYRITAVALDSGGQSTVSSSVTCIAALPSSLGNDTIYKGTSGNGVWRLVFIAKSDGSGLLIASSSAAPAAGRLFTGATISSGVVTIKDGSGTVVLSGTVNDTGFSGTFSPSGTALPFIIPVVVPTNLSFTPGVYSGSISGRLASVFHAVLAGDGTLNAIFGEGSVLETGTTSVATDGSFLLSLSNGSKITGKVDATTGFISGTATGPFSGSLLAILASGSEISDSSLRGISTRSPIGVGDNILIAGFIIDGSSTKSILVRGLGPTLATANLNGLLSNPMMEFYSAGTKIDAYSNDNWGGSAALLNAMSAISLSVPTSTLEAVSNPTLGSGSYTTIVKGVSNGTGIGLVEIYDGEAHAPFASPRLRALSSRGYVSTNDNVMIAGLIIEGSAPIKVIIRGLGPTLGSVVSSPVLQDPVITLNDIGRGRVIRENDDWEIGNDPSALAAACARMGPSALASGSKDASMLLKLPPGIYTVTLRGRNNGVGVGMIEIYEVR